MPVRVSHRGHVYYAVPWWLVPFMLPFWIVGGVLKAVFGGGSKRRRTARPRAMRSR